MVTSFPSLTKRFFDGLAKDEDNHNTHIKAGQVVILCLDDLKHPLVVAKLPNNKWGGKATAVDTVDGSKNPAFTS